MNKIQDSGRMPRRHQGGLALSALTAAISMLVVGSAFASPTLNWQTVVNNNVAVPVDADPSQRNFNSYNQPSVNNGGLVVFRARSRGGQPSGEPASGIFTRDMSSTGNPVTTVMSRNTVAPAPTVVNPAAGYLYAPTGATFNEFPAIPRIDSRSNTIASRGQTQPVLQVTDPSGNGTRVGTSGVYANPNGVLTSGVTNLGNVPGLTHLQVPGQPAGTRFDQFPGSPSVTDTSKIVFKGNFAGGTGVYWRDLADPANRVVRIADTTTPGTEYFGGSTAPPSAALGHAVFIGVDNEDNPSRGGIFMADLVLSPSLQKMAGIGDGVQGFADLAADQQRLTRIGEALSFDGRYIAFWGAVGTATRAVDLQCPNDGNADIRQACLSQDNNGVANDGNYRFEVARDQGIFLLDTGANGGPVTTLLARTGTGSQDFLDFTYWGFSGHPPGVGGGDEPLDGEPPRWRSAQFLAVDQGNVAFKGTTNEGLLGLYLQAGQAPLQTLARQGNDGGLLDSDASGLAITALGIERDGFRNGWLAISSSMTDGVESMAGIYITRVPAPGPLALMLIGLPWLVARSTRRRQR